QSARLTPPVPVQTVEKSDEMILQDMLQIEKLVEESENVDDSSPTRHDDTSIPGTRLEPKSDKESLEVEIVQEKEEEATKDTEVEPNIVIPVNVDDEDDEITDEVFELRRRVKGKNVEETRISPIPSPTRSLRNLSTLVSSDTEKLQELMVTHSTPSSEGLILERKMTKEETERLISKAILQERGRMQAHISSQIQNVIDNVIPSLVEASVCSYMSGQILHVRHEQVQSSSVPEQQNQLYLAMKADPLPSAIRTRDQDDPHDDAHPEGENSAKRQKTSEYEAYVSRESSSGQENVEEPGPSTSGNQE
ncbi:hypothetical protein Tco_1277485, partial [Tanacetum coccineum]